MTPKFIVLVLGRQFHFTARKIQVIRIVDGNQVNMRMRHFQSNNADTATVTVKCFFDGFGNGLGKNKYFLQVIAWQVKQVINFNFWID